MNKRFKGSTALLKLSHTHILRCCTRFNQKNPLKCVYKKTTHTFLHNTFKTKQIVKFGLLNKNLKDVPEYLKLNTNLHSGNTPFLTTFLTQKGTTGINIYEIFVYFQAFNQIIKSTINYMIILHIPKLQ